MNKLSLAWAKTSGRGRVKTGFIVAKPFHIRNR